tara:strand:- start:678 stop:1523 length:846 start_codon:yes stop_codon:yes gene_type:complete
VGFFDKLNDQERNREALFDSGLGSDASDSYANLNQLYIEFYHVPTNRSVTFKAYIKEWSDKFDSSYKSEDVYGRNDPIHTFQGTSREISLGWQCVAASSGEATENLARVSMLAQYLYPSYNVQDFNFAGESLAVGTMTKAPLIKVRFANLIVDAENGNLATIDAKTGGLLCAMTGLNISADFDAGVVDGYGLSTPKVIELSTTLKVLHQHPLGWDQNKNWMGGNDGFPYNTFGDGSATPDHIEDRYIGIGTRGSGTGRATPRTTPPAPSGAGIPGVDPSNP